MLEAISESRRWSAYPINAGGASARNRGNPQ